MIADFDDLWEGIDQAWAQARQAREYSRTACARTILMRQEVQRAYRRTLTACMAPSMPTANAWTREITATILASHGLLNKPPALRSLTGVTTGAPPRRHRRRKADHHDDG